MHLYYKPSRLMSQYILIRVNNATGSSVLTAPHHMTGEVQGHIWCKSTAGAAAAYHQT